MNRAILANRVARADLHRALDRWIETQILRDSADDCAVTNKIPGAHFHRSFDDDMGLDRPLLANHRAATDYGIRTNYNIRSELRGRIDDRCRMNLHRTPASLKLKYGCRPSAGAPM